MKYSRSLAVCVLGLIAVAAQGQVVTYDSYLAWEADVQALLAVASTERNWEAFPVFTALDGTELLPEVTYAPPGGDDGTMVVEDLISGPSVTLEGKVFTRGLGRTISDDSMAFFGNFSAFGVFILESDTEYTPEAVLYYAPPEEDANLGELLAMQPFPKGPDVDPTTSQKIAFVGAIGFGGERIATVLLDEASEPDGHRDNVGYGGVVFTTAPVPEPASLGLLGLGAVGALWRRRRRK